MASLDDIVTVGNTLNKNIAALLQSINLTLGALGKLYSGTVTLGAAATTVVTNTNVLANSQIVLMPTNAAAGTLVSGANSPYISARTAGTSFTIATAGGGAAAGTETFQYMIVNP